MRTAVIYARVSSISDRQNTDRQVSDLQSYASKRDYNIVEVFTEHASGAKKNTERQTLCECLNFCIENKVDTLLISELSRLGRNVDEVLANVRFCKENHLNIYFQKEDLNTYNNGEENPFLTIIIAVLGTCAQMERDNIKFRLNSGKAQYIANGGKLGRKLGSVKTPEQKKEEYKEVITLLKRGYSVRNVAKLASVSNSTVQRVKKEFAL